MVSPRTCRTGRPRSEAAPPAERAGWGRRTAWWRQGAGFPSGPIRAGGERHCDFPPRSEFLQTKSRLPLWAAPSLCWGKTFTKVFFSIWWGGSGCPYLSMGAGGGGGSPLIHLCLPPSAAHQVSPLLISFITPPASSSPPASLLIFHKLSLCSLQSLQMFRISVFVRCANLHEIKCI